MGQSPQISLFFELDGYEKAAEKHGISVDNIMSFGSGKSREIEVTGAELISIDPNSIPKDEEISAGCYTIYFYNHERIQTKTGVAPLTLRHSG